MNEDLQGRCPKSVARFAAGRRAEQAKDWGSGNAGGWAGGAPKNLGTAGLEHNIHLLLNISSLQQQAFPSPAASCSCQLISPPPPKKKHDFLQLVKEAFSKKVLILEEFIEGVGFIG